MIAVSYAWLCPEDPDPRGEQLASICAVLEAFTAEKAEGGDVPGKATRTGVDGTQRYGVFIDRMSLEVLPQAAAEAEGDAGAGTSARRARTWRASVASTRAPRR